MGGIKNKPQCNHEQAENDGIARKKWGGVFYGFSNGILHGILVCMQNTFSMAEM